jgi:hypothetical protein
VLDWAGILGSVASPLRSAALAWAAALALVGSALAGCGFSGLAFFEDDRVDIVRPADRAEVRVPLTVAWTADGVPAGSFGVFVDRAPQPPGRPLDWLFRDDRLCQGPDGRVACASREFLERQQVFETEETSIVIPSVRRLTGEDRRRQFHEVTVVLLDESGERVGESAWSVRFEVDRT